MCLGAAGAAPPEATGAMRAALMTSSSTRRQSLVTLSSRQQGKRTRCRQGEEDRREVRCWDDGKESSADARFKCSYFDLLHCKFKPVRTLTLLKHTSSSVSILASSVTPSELWTSSCKRGKEQGKNWKSGFSLDELLSNGECKLIN